MIVFPQNPAAQTPTNVFSPTSTPVQNTFNQAIYRWVAADSQWVYDGPNVNPGPPSPGAEIATPSITTPANDTTNIPADADLTLEYSAYSPSTGAGEHASTSLQVVAGELPLVSTNRVTGVTINETDWTVGAEIIPTENRPNSMLAGIWRFPNNRVMAVFSEKGFTAAEGEKFFIFISDDNGATWTDDSDRAAATNGGDRGYFISRGANPGSGNSMASEQIQRGDAAGDMFFILESNRATFAHGWLYYDWSEDTYSGRASASISSSVFDWFKGEFADGTQIWGTGPGANQRSRLMDPDNLPTGSDELPGTALAPSGIGAFAINDNIAWGWTSNGSTSSSSAFNPVRMFITTNRNDLSDSSAMTTWDTNIFGESEKLRIYWVPQIQRFISLGSSGIVVLYDPTQGASDDGLTFMNVGTVESLGGYWFDGTNHILITANSNQAIYSNDFENWTIVDNFSPWVNSDDGTYYTINRTGPINDPDSLQVQSATNFDAATVLTISGAQTDGFAVGMNVENRGGVAATGAITDIDNTSVRLLPTTGTWTDDSTQRIAIPASEFNTIIDDRQDTTNLTGRVIDESLLSNNTDYRARIQYRSDRNVTSDISPWSSFSTGGN